MADVKFLNTVVICLLQNHDARHIFLYFLYFFPIIWKFLNMPPLLSIRHQEKAIINFTQQFNSNLLNESPKKPISKRKMIWKYIKERLKLSIKPSVISDSALSSLAFLSTTKLSTVPTFCWWIRAFLVVTSCSFFSMWNLLSFSSNSSMHTFNSGLANFLLCWDQCEHRIYYWVVIVRRCKNEKVQNTIPY